jgi:hypothetical protein
MKFKSILIILIITFGLSAGCQKTQSTTIPSKNEQKFGYIKDISQKDGKTFLSFDEAEHFDGGEKGRKAALEDGQCTKLEECLPNPFYIRNKDEQTISLPISQNCEVIMATLSYEKDGSPKSEKISFEKFLDIFEHKKDFPQINPNPPYHLELTNGEVVKITEHYIP